MPTHRSATLLATLLLPTVVIAECLPLDTLPAVIDEPGCYRLAVSAHLLLKSGSAISIDSDDVVLDLGGHVISNGIPGSNTANGVGAYRRENVTVRNGSIRGFATGVALGMDRPGGFGGYVVENLQLYGNTMFGLDLRGGWITARGNRIIRTGGSQVTGWIGTGMGIYTAGTMVTIVDNDIINVIGNTGSTWGIRMSGAHAGVVEGNRVLGAGTGIEVYGSGAISCRDNTFAEISVNAMSCPLDAGGNGGEIN